MNKKVVLGMSGGVDSSVAAYLLKEQGYDVIGITMNVWPKEHCEKDQREKACCGLSSVNDARKVAAQLDIPYYVLNFRAIFKEKVINDFTDEYSKGRTPNPCVRCNEHIKFNAMLQKAKEIGADYIATGHHSKIEFDGKNKRYLLKKSKDENKDQTYFLYTLTQEQLKHTLMPIGDLQKQEVREIAKKLDIAVADKQESQEICFVIDDNYHEFLKERIPDKIKPGNIVNSKGEVLGKHEGIVFYTVGQRRGMGVASTDPLYVKTIVPKTNTVVVGFRDELYTKELIATDVNLINIDKLKEPVKAIVKTRYRQKGAQAMIFPVQGNKVKVVFDEPAWGVSLGQAVVFYNEDYVIGGATIAQTIEGK